MIRFYGSSNARYFLTVQDKHVTLYHEDKVMWSTDLIHTDFEVLGVGSNSCVAMWFKEGVYLFRPGERVRAEALKKLQTSVFQKTESVLSDIFYNDEGSSFVYMRVSGKSKVTEKLFGALSSAPTEKGLKEFELIFYDIPSESAHTLHKMVHPLSMEKYVKWSISRDFNYLVLGNPRKIPSGVSVKYSIIDTQSFKTVRSFELQDTEVRSIRVNNEGTALLEASKRGVENILVVTKDANSYNIQRPTDAEILHLGRSFVAFHVHRPPAFIVKSLDDRELITNNLSIFEQHKVEYALLFNARDTMSLLYLKDDQLYHFITDMSTLITEIRRFELVMRKKQAEEQAPVEQPVKYEVPSTSPLREAPERPHSLKRPSAIEFFLEREPVKPSRDEFITLEDTSSPPQAPEPAEEPAEEEAGATSLPVVKIPDKTELFQMLETLKLHLVMGIVDDKAYQEKKQAIERMIELQDKQPSLQAASPAASAAPQKAGEQESPSSEEEKEREKIQKLLESLEERFILGEINETSYRELKAKYHRSLSAKRFQASPSQTSKG
ncbi:MAG: hypothetical protein RDV48_08790 [Candidatus Eremiobacteraeota bacterium]|nr:hypothetical protein [Candidatus Eremiobacteraeota bacterium]